MSLLELRSIVKTYPGVRALDDVDFTLESGQIHALIGVNGAGKSTLVKVIAGAEKPDSGSIQVDGQSVAIDQVSDASQAGIAVVHQERTLIKHLTVAENIMLGAEPSQNGIINGRSLVAKARELIERLGVTELDLNENVENLGAGTQQLVDITRALRTSPKVLVLDEPTAALSAGETEHLFNVMRRFKQRGVGIIFVSHHLDEIFEVADTITILRDGRVVSEGPIENYSPESIPQMIVGREISAISSDYVDASDNPVLLEIQNLSGEGFSDVSLKVHQGEVVALAGVVGAGRTELLETLVGYRRADSGSVSLHGSMQRLSSPQQAIKNGLILVPDKRMEKGLMMRLDVLENLSIASLEQHTALGVVKEKSVLAAAQEAIKRLNIKTPSVSANIGNLSGGNKQKVVFGKWLSAIENVQDQVFLFDEPTEGIDVGARAEMWNIIRDLAHQGAGVIVASSDLEELMALGDRLCIMRGGRIVNTGHRSHYTHDRVLQLMISSAEGQSAPVPQMESE